jgi:hypothetical protein
MRPIDKFFPKDDRKQVVLRGGLSKEEAIQRLTQRFKSERQAKINWYKKNRK